MHRPHRHAGPDGHRRRHRRRGHRHRDGRGSRHRRRERRRRHHRRGSYRRRRRTDRHWGPRDGRRRGGAHRYAADGDRRHHRDAGACCRARHRLGAVHPDGAHRVAEPADAAAEWADRRAAPTRTGCCRRAGCERPAWARVRGRVSCPAAVPAGWAADPEPELAGPGSAGPARWAWPPEPSEQLGWPPRWRRPELPELPELPRPQRPDGPRGWGLPAWRRRVTSSRCRPPCPAPGPGRRPTASRRPRPCRVPWPPGFARRPSRVPPCRRRTTRVAAGLPAPPPSTTRT